MQVIGFNFTKISGERMTEIKQPSLSTNIEFTNYEKENITLLKDSEEAAKITFQYSVNYQTNKKEEEKQGEIVIGGRKRANKCLEKKRNP